MDKLPETNKQILKVIYDKGRTQEHVTATTPPTAIYYTITVFDIDILPKFLSALRATVCEGLTQGPYTGSEWRLTLIAYM